MNVEARLLSKILLEKSLRHVLDARIRPDFFQDEYHSELFGWMIDYYNRYGKTPTAGALKSNYPTFKVVAAPEELDWYIDQLKAAREYAVMAEAVAEAGSYLKHQQDAEKARTSLHAAMSKLDADLSPLRDVNLSDPEYIESWIAEYEELENLDGALRGLPSGFKTIDRATSGFQSEQLITVIGEPKAGKSTALMCMYKAVHDHGRVPLFVGFEMSNDEQKNRYAAIRARINYNKLYTGRLNKGEKASFVRALRELENTPDLWLTTDPSATSTLSGLQAKVDAYDPAALFVDGVYLMVDELSGEQNTPLALTNLTRGLKRMAQRLRIPIICSTQALTWKVSRRKGLTMNSIGYTSSFAQDSDVILGLESVDDEDDHKRLKIVAARNLRNFTVDLNWDWDTGTFEEMDAYEHEDDEASI